MTHSSKIALAASGSTLSSFRVPTVRCDVAATLSRTLGTAWSVQREVDYEGEISIVVLGADDSADMMPSFILYERDGLAWVAMVKDDEWRSRRGFASALEAATAIAAEIGSSRARSVI